VLRTILPPFSPFFCLSLRFAPVARRGNARFLESLLGPFEIPRAQFSSFISHGTGEKSPRARLLFSSPPPPFFSVRFSPYLLTLNHLLPPSLSTCIVSWASKHFVFRPCQRLPANTLFSFDPDAFFFIARTSYVGSSSSLPSFRPCSSLSEPLFPPAFPPSIFRCNV